jgi:hypothetical protein
VVGFLGFLARMFEGGLKGVGKVFVQGIGEEGQMKNDESNGYKDNDSSNHNDNVKGNGDLAKAAGTVASWVDGDGWLVRAMIDLVDGVEKEWKATIESIEEKKRRKWYED